MQDKAQKCYQAHKATFDCWNYGEIDEIWADDNDVLCIRYRSGAWWHYKIVDNVVTWW